MYGDRIVPMHIREALPASPRRMFAKSDTVEKCDGGNGMQKKQDLKKKQTNDEETTSKSLTEDTTMSNEVEEIFKGFGKKKGAKAKPGNQTDPQAGKGKGHGSQVGSSRGGPKLGTVAKNPLPAKSPIEGKAKKSLFPCAGEDVRIASYAQEKNPPEEK